MAQQVFPTKSNLMATKRSLALATQGYDLMDRKRNILVREMMQLIDRAAGIQDRISAAYAEAYEALKKANIMLGSVGGYAAGVPVERGVQMSTRSVMGVELPTLRLNTTSPMGLYYDLESTNGTLDVAYLKFNEVKTLTVELAEVETSVIRLAEAIQKTQKRANALGNVQIPQMQKTIKSIDEVLSEREREEFSRLKVIKAQKAKWYPPRTTPCRKKVYSAPAAKPVIPPRNWWLKSRAMPSTWFERKGRWSEPPSDPRIGRP